MVTSLLPSATPLGWASTQVGPPETTETASTSAEQAPSEYRETSPEQAPPAGWPHVHGEHPRPSSAPS